MSQLMTESEKERMRARIVPGAKLRFVRPGHLTSGWYRQEAIVEVVPHLPPPSTFFDFMTKSRSEDEVVGHCAVQGFVWEELYAGDVVLVDDAPAASHELARPVATATKHVFVRYGDGGEELLRFEGNDIFIRGRAAGTDAELVAGMLALVRGWDVARLGADNRQLSERCAKFEAALGEAQAEVGRLQLELRRRR